MNIIKKNSGGRRPRIQFYLTDKLDRLVTENRQLAKKHGLRIDYQDAFRAWFEKENQQAHAQLAQLDEKKANNGNAQAD
jgi:hypothetical protein